MTTVVSFIIVAAVLSYLLLVLAFILKDYTIAMLASLGILCTGIYMAIYNVESINNILTQAFALISIGLGSYIFINGSVEKIKELM